jgi:DNA end-binding protein Ku
VPRAETVKGYELEKGQFVLSTPDELKKLDEGADYVIEIVSFVPEKSVNPSTTTSPTFLHPTSAAASPVRC